MAFNCRKDIGPRSENARVDVVATGECHFAYCLAMAGAGWDTPKESANTYKPSNRIWVKKSSHSKQHALT